MMLTHEQRQIRKEIYDEMEVARRKATIEVLDRRCNRVPATFEERPLSMHTDIICPTAKCPNNITCNSCNQCIYYISSDKESGAVYCLKLN